MQIYKKQPHQVYLVEAVFVNLYGEEPFMSKSRVSKRHFCEGALRKFTGITAWKHVVVLFVSMLKYDASDIGRHAVSKE